MYIRTKDGIYDFKNNSMLNIQGDELFLAERVDYYIYYKLLGKIIKQADTIEELCDGFYIDDELLNRFNKYAIFEKDQHEKFKDIAITYMKGMIPLVAYGFVKTDKGLIYVAKLNENGELILI